jgi:AbrB family looped-hinge helix DNA binding protein
MTTTIDAAGRVVIPLGIRTRAGFRAGTTLEVSLDDSGVRLTRTVAGPKLVKVGSRLVARPTVAPHEVPVVDFADLVERERDRWPW